MSAQISHLFNKLNELRMVAIGKPFGLSPNHSKIVYLVVIDRSNWETWTDAGSKTYQDRLAPEVDRLLEAHQPEVLDEKLIQEMKKIISLADKKEV